MSSKKFSDFNLTNDIDNGFLVGYNGTKNIRIPIDVLKAILAGKYDEYAKQIAELHERLEVLENNDTNIIVEIQ